MIAFCCSILFNICSIPYSILHQFICFREWKQILTSCRSRTFICFSLKSFVKHFLLTDLCCWVETRAFSKHRQHIFWQVKNKNSKGVWAGETKTRPHAHKTNCRFELKCLKGWKVCPERVTAPLTELQSAAQFCPEWPFFCALSINHSLCWNHVKAAMKAVQDLSICLHACQQRLQGKCKQSDLKEKLFLKMVFVWIPLSWTSAANLTASSGTGS